jgi:hypothetical protein
VVNARSRCARPTPAASLLIRVKIGPNAGNTHMPSKLLTQAGAKGELPRRVRLRTHQDDSPIRFLRFFC